MLTILAVTALPTLGIAALMRILLIWLDRTRDTRPRTKAEMVREIRRILGAWPPNQLEYAPERWTHPYRWFGWLLPASWVARRYERDELVMTLEDLGHRAER